MPGQIPDLRILDEPRARGVHPAGTTRTETALNKWCTGNDYTADVYTTGAGVAVTLTHTAGTSYIFRGNTRADAITLAADWAGIT